MIVSKFYLIRGDSKPIYVGYTNRPIRQRFTEHKKDKDFSQYNKVTVEKIDELDYDFTWDEQILYKNANEVSLREGELILQYNTQDSEYQKEDAGGQTWAFEKWFVKSNKNNPKFTGMSGDEIQDYIQSEHEVEQFMSHFVNHMVEPVEQFMGNFVSHMQDPVEVFMSHFTSGMSDPIETFMGNFINNMNDSIEIFMGNFINHMNDPVEQFMNSFVGNMKDPVEVFMIDFVNSMKYLVEAFMIDFINVMNDPVEIFMKNFVNNMIKKEKYNDKY